MNGLSARIMIACLVLGVGLISKGATGVHDAASNSSITEISLPDLVKHKPEKTWLRVTGGVLVVPEAIWEEVDGRIESAYVPLLDPDDVQEKSKIHLLVHTTDQQTLALIRQIQTVEKMNNEAATAQLVKQKGKELFPQHDVSGVVQWGANSSSSVRRDVERLSGQVSSDFMILDDAAKPDGGTSGLSLLGGIALCLVPAGWLVHHLTSKSRERAAREAMLARRREAPEPVVEKYARSVTKAVAKPTVAKPASSETPAGEDAPKKSKPLLARKPRKLS